MSKPSSCRFEKAAQAAMIQGPPRPTCPKFALATASASASNSSTERSFCTTPPQTMQTGATGILGLEEEPALAAMNQGVPVSSGV